MEERKQQDKRQTLLSQAIGFFFSLIFWLLFSLTISIIIEWIGLTFIWSDEGANHAKNMYFKELSYINEGFSNQFINHDQVEFVSTVNSQYEYYSNYLGLNRVSNWMITNSGDLMGFIQLGKQAVESYIISAAYITKVFVVRLSILMLSISSFIIAFLIGATDGLVERDRRKWGGGRESATIYLLGRYSLKPLFIGAWVIYLSLPFSVHPSLIILPFVIMFGFSVRTTCEKMKKYF